MPSTPEDFPNLIMAKLLSIKDKIYRSASVTGQAK